MAEKKMNNERRKTRDYDARCWECRYRGYTCFDCQNGRSFPDRRKVKHEENRSRDRLENSQNRPRHVRNRIASVSLTLFRSFWRDFWQDDVTVLKQFGQIERNSVKCINVTRETFGDIGQVDQLGHSDTREVYRNRTE